MDYDMDMKMKEEEGKEKGDNKEAKSGGKGQQQAQSQKQSMEFHRRVLEKRLGGEGYVFFFCFFSILSPFSSFLFSPTNSRGFGRYKRRMEG